MTAWTESAKRTKLILDFRARGLLRFAGFSYPAGFALPFPAAPVPTLFSTRNADPYSREGQMRAGPAVIPTKQYGQPQAPESEELMADHTAAKQPAHLNPDLQFKPGQSGNPKGRPKGARSKLGEAFLQDMLASWEEHGAVTIEKVRTEDPTQYVKVVASILPKEMNLRVGEFDDLTDDQLARQLASIASQLARAGVDLGAGVGSSAAAQSTGDVPTLQ